MILEFKQWKLEPDLILSMLIDCPLCGKEASEQLKPRRGWGDPRQKPKLRRFYCHRCGITYEEKYEESNCGSKGPGDEKVQN